MSFVPSVSIQITGNKCGCCGNTEKLHPSELTVYYSKSKGVLVAVPKEVASPKSTEEKTRATFEKFQQEIWRLYQVQFDEILEKSSQGELKKLPSLEALRGIEKKAHDKWQQTSNDSIKESPNVRSPFYST